MILADENIDKEIIKAIRATGLEVLSIFESHQGIDDFQILELSRNPPRIILTEDKDFGEWVFAHRVKGVSVLFVRYTFAETPEIIKMLIYLLSADIDSLKGKFTTVTTRKIRSRDI